MSKLTPWSILLKVIHQVSGLINCARKQGWKGKDSGVWNPVFRALQAVLESDFWADFSTCYRSLFAMWQTNNFPCDFHDGAAHCVVVTLRFIEQFGFKETKFLPKVTQLWYRNKSNSELPDSGLSSWILQYTAALPFLPCLKQTVTPNLHNP